MITALVNEFFLQFSFDKEHMQTIFYTNLVKSF